MSFPSLLGAIAARLVGELVGPSRCAACDEPVSSNVVFCPPCASSVERIEPAIQHGCIAVFEYGGAMATALGRLKYGDRADLGPRLGRMMLPAAEHLRGQVDVVVPVPLHPRRLAERGYNQAALLARPVTRALGARSAPRALARYRNTPRQALLDRAERLANVRQAFAVSDRASILGARVLLVDDVRTTGATLDACAMALEAAGARDVIELVLAQRS